MSTKGDIMRDVVLDAVPNAVPKHRVPDYAAIGRLGGIATAALPLRAAPKPPRQGEMPSRPWLLMQLVEMAKKSEKEEVRAKILFGLIDLQSSTSDSSVSSLMRLLAGATAGTGADTPGLLKDGGGNGDSSD